jgi:hypothetical protein
MLKTIFYGHYHIPTDRPVHTRTVHEDVATNVAIFTNTMVPRGQSGVRLEDR